MKHQPVCHWSEPAAQRRKCDWPGTFTSHTMGFWLLRKKGQWVYISQCLPLPAVARKRSNLSPSHGFPCSTECSHTTTGPAAQTASTQLSAAHRERSLSQFNGSAFYICLSASSRLISQEADWSWTWFSPLISPRRRKGLRAINFKFEATEMSKHFQMSISSANLCTLLDV